MDGHGKNKYFIAKNKGKLNLVEKKEKNVHYKYMWQLVYEHLQYIKNFSKSLRYKLPEKNKLRKYM